MNKEKVLSTLAKSSQKTAKSVFSVYRCTHIQHITIKRTPAHDTSAMSQLEDTRRNVTIRSQRLLNRKSQKRNKIRNKKQQSEKGQKQEQKAKKGLKKAQFTHIHTSGEVSTFSSTHTRVTYKPTEAQANGTLS